MVAHQVMDRNKSRLLALLLTAVGAFGCQSSAPGARADRDLFIVRHAQAWSNLPVAERGGRDDDQCDALTPLGVAQAEATAAQLLGNGVTTVFHSPRGRTRETAAIIATRCGAVCFALDALRPMDADESVAAATARALAALSQRAEAGNWVIVSHSGVTAAILGEADGTPADMRVVKERILPTGGMRQVRWQADGAWQIP